MLFTSLGLLVTVPGGGLDEIDVNPILDSAKTGKLKTIDVIGICNNLIGFVI